MKQAEFHVSVCKLIKNYKKPEEKSSLEDQTAFANQQKFMNAVSDNLAAGLKALTLLGKKQAADRITAVRNECFPKDGIATVVGPLSYDYAKKVVQPYQEMFQKIENPGGWFEGPAVTEKQQEMEPRIAALKQRLEAYEQANQLTTAASATLSV